MGLVKSFKKKKRKIAEATPERQKCPMGTTDGDINNPKDITTTDRSMTNNMVNTDIYITTFK